MASERGVFQNRPKGNDGGGSFGHAIQLAQILPEHRTLEAEQRIRAAEAEARRSAREAHTARAIS